MNFYEKFVSLCNKQGIAPSNIDEEIGIKQQTISYWKKGGKPRTSTILKICEYFGVEPSYFQEEEKTELKQMLDPALITMYYLYGSTPPSDEEWQELQQFIEWQKFKRI